MALLFGLRELGLGFRQTMEGAEATVAGGAVEPSSGKVVTAGANGHAILVIAYHLLG